VNPGARNIINEEGGNPLGQSRAVREALGHTVEAKGGLGGANKEGKFTWELVVKTWSIQCDSIPVSWEGNKFLQVSEIAQRAGYTQALGLDQGGIYQRAS